VKNGNNYSQMKEEEFNSKLYPHLCWHKHKRLLPRRMLDALSAQETQPDYAPRTPSVGIMAGLYSATSQGPYNVESLQKDYITESVKLMKELKKISGSSQSVPSKIVPI